MLDRFLSHYERTTIFALGTLCGVMATMIGYLVGELL